MASLFFQTKHSSKNKLYGTWKIPSLKVIPLDENHLVKQFVTNPGKTNNYSSKANQLQSNHQFKHKIGCRWVERGITSEQVHYAKPLFSFKFWLKTYCSVLACASSSGISKCHQSGTDVLYTIYMVNGGKGSMSLEYGRCTSNEAL